MADNEYRVELVQRVRELEADRRTYKSLYEVQQKLYLSDITRARRAGQGQALKELLEEIDWVRTSEGDRALDHLECWATDKLKELGEECREEGAIP